MCESQNSCNGWYTLCNDALEVFFSAPVVVTSSMPCHAASTTSECIPMDETGKVSSKTFDSKSKSLENSFFRTTVTDWMTELA